MIVFFMFHFISGIIIWNQIQKHVKTKLLNGNFFWTEWSWLKTRGCGSSHLRWWWGFHLPSKWKDILDVPKMDLWRFEFGSALRDVSPTKSENFSPGFAKKMYTLPTQTNSSPLNHCGFQEESPNFQGTSHFQGLLLLVSGKVISRPGFLRHL